MYISLGGQVPSDDANFDFGAVSVYLAKLEFCWFLRSVRSSRYSVTQ